MDTPDSTDINWDRELDCMKNVYRPLPGSAVFTSAAANHSSAGARARARARAERCTSAVRAQTSARSACSVVCTYTAWKGREVGDQSATVEYGLPSHQATGQASKGRTVLITRGHAIPETLAG